MNTHVAYRPDIDGLRALAVLLVILFHFELLGDTNGFIGVDIFFVISGYLITRIIHDELAGGTFSLAGFYKRRALRIMPALTVVLVATTIGAMLLFMPVHLLAFGKSLMAQSAFASNFLFWKEAGYFDANANLKPLLHTWSLAIEEQFYIFFPLILMAISRKNPASIYGWVKGIWLVSFILNVVMIARGNDHGTFFLLHSRAWELVTGSILALRILPALTPKNASYVGWGSLVLLLCGTFIPVSADQFPGWFALLPVLGAAGVIYAGMGQPNLGSGFNRFLARRQMVAIGKISYSLYLWHWPVYVLATYYAMGHMGLGIKIQALALCFALSYLSWQYIEQPFRQHGVRWPAKPILIVSAAILFVFAAIGGGIVATKGMEFRFPARILSILDAPIGKNYPHAAVAGAPRAKALGTQVKNDAYVYAVWGDSHAQAIAPAMEAAVGMEAPGVFISDNACMLLPEFVANLPEDQAECAAKVAKQLDWIVQNKSLRTVLIAQRWSERLKAWDKEHDFASTPALRALRERSLLVIVEKLQAAGKQVIILAQVPQMGEERDDIPSLAARADLFHKPFPKAPSVSGYLERYGVMYALLENIAKQTGATLVRPHEVLCEKDQCHYLEGDKSLYFDDDHLSVHGAMKMVPALRTALDTDQN